MFDPRTTPYAALLLRLSLGTMFVAHALLKVFVFTVPGTVQFFQSLGLPGALAYVTIAAELIGGALLILGVKGRLGVPRVLDDHALRAGPARRRRACFALRRCRAPVPAASRLIAFE